MGGIWCTWDHLFVFDFTFETWVTWDSFTCEVTYLGTGDSFTWVTWDSFTCAVMYLSTWDSFTWVTWDSFTWDLSYLSTCKTWDSFTWVTWDSCTWDLSYLTTWKTWDSFTWKDWCHGYFSWIVYAILYAVYMHFICILYAFYMQFICSFYAFFMQFICSFYAPFMQLDLCYLSTLYVVPANQAQFEHVPDMGAHRRKIKYDIHACWIKKWHYIFTSTYHK